MPYILRKPHKVREYAGHLGFMKIKNSLIAHFRDNPVLDIKQVAGDAYPTLVIEDVTNPAKSISFYIVAQEGIWYRIAFKEFIG